MKTICGPFDEEKLTTQARAMDGFFLNVPLPDVFDHVPLTVS